MAYRGHRLTYTSPAAQRRHVQAQRRSMCCCSLMVLLSLLIAVLAFRGAIRGHLDRRRQPQPPQVSFPLSIETERAWYYRYHLVPFTLTSLQPDGQPRRDTPPVVTVRYQGKAAPLLGHFNHLPVRYDEATGTWRGYWPPYWNSEPGTYIIEARIPIDPTQWEWWTPKQKRQYRREHGGAEPQAAGEAWAVAAVPVTLQARERASLPPGMCVATWEFDFRETFVGPDGSRGDWRKLFDWVDYVGADTFWFRGAVTEGRGLTLQQPFKQINLDAIPKLGEEAHRRGLKFGTWAVAYSTYPRSNDGKPPYDFALDVSRTTGAARYHNFISLLDDRRVAALTDFFRRMQESEHVDMVGLDYMRSDRGGYEMVERFTSEMPVRLPDAWSQWSERRRQQYVAYKVEEEWQKDAKFYECWNWWRAHIGAEIVRRIIDGSGVQKPTWIFVLTWLHGTQHGQDPLMFTDAGISMLAPMLYQVDSRGMFDEVVEAWQEYLKPGQVNLAPGDQVDFYWHQKMVSPRPAPAELYDRIVTAHEQFCRGERQMGAFWHDINRAASGTNLGPFSGREWALAGAAAFSRVRDSWGVYPLRVTLQAPDTAPVASTFTVTVNIENLTQRDVRNIEVAVCDTPLIIARDLTQTNDRRERFTTVSVLNGKQTVQVPIQLRIARADAARGNRAMVAIRVRWAAGDFPAPVRNELPRQIVVMKYVRGT